MSRRKKIIKNFMAQAVSTDENVQDTERKKRCVIVVSQKQNSSRGEKHKNLLRNFNFRHKFFLVSWQIICNILFDINFPQQQIFLLISDDPQFMFDCTCHSNYFSTLSQFFDLIAINFSPSIKIER